MRNNNFIKLGDIIKEEKGSIDTKEVYREWHAWLNRQVKRLAF